jgi:pimeloyl-ACP methyl ester carboxylesterase
MFVVIAGLTLALAIDLVRTGGPAAWLARHHLVPPYIGQGARVDIGGRSLYLDCRGRGAPTIVFESGMGDGAAGWTAVHDALAATTRTCAYDRAGRGSSDPRDRHTAADAADDLDAVLAAAGETSPFVVVGHSLGEVYARVFADRYREQVAGLVLVDGFSVDLEAALIHPLLGDLRPEYERRAQNLRDLVAAVERLDWPTSEAQLRASDVRGLSIVVLRAPREEPRLDKSTNAAIAQAWQAAYESLSPGRVHYEIAWGSGHVVQADRPDLLIDATRSLVETIRGSAGR